MQPVLLHGGCQQSRGTSHADAYGRAAVPVRTLLQGIQPAMQPGAALQDAHRSATIKRHFKKTCLEPPQCHPALEPYYNNAWDKRNPTMPCTDGQLALERLSQYIYKFTGFEIPLFQCNPLPCSSIGKLNKSKEAMPESSGDPSMLAKKSYLPLTVFNFIMSQPLTSR